MPDTAFCFDFIDLDGSKQIVEKAGSKVLMLICFVVIPNGEEIGTIFTNVIPSPGCHAQVPTSLSSEDESLEERSAISLGVSGLPCSNQRIMISINSEAVSAGASLP